MDAAQEAAVLARWRIRLGIAVAVMAGIVLVHTALAVGYGELSLTTLSWWGGLAAVVLARRSVPRGLSPEHRPQLAASARWTVLALLLFVAVPVLIAQLQ